MPKFHFPLEENYDSFKWFESVTVVLIELFVAFVCVTQMLHFGFMSNVFGLTPVIIFLFNDLFRFFNAQMKSNIFLKIASINLIVLSIV